MHILIRSALDADLHEVRDWMSRDTSSENYSSLAANREIIRIDRAEDAWVAVREGEVVAYASFSSDKAGAAYVGFIVKPSARRQGIAKEFIPRLLEHQDIKRYSKIIGSSRLGDTATEKILRHAGFYQTGYDENGLMMYERR
jgi:RimJ/RimL family protein N-acetyltransferase